MGMIHKKEGGHVQKRVRVSLTYRQTSDSKGFESNLITNLIWNLKEKLARS